MDECITAHRGAPDSIAKFGPRFIKARLVGFEKDMKICLKSTNHPITNKTTHAYFPALASCCSTLEYMANLYRGDMDSAGEPQISAFAAKYLAQPQYNRVLMRVLVYAFRHTVAHRGIASGVWVERRNDVQIQKRVVWKITASTHHPALELKPEDGMLKMDPPWLTPYNYRMRINLGRLWRDIRDASKEYAKELRTNDNLQSNFRRCMEQLYPLH